MRRTVLASSCLVLVCACGDWYEEDGFSIYSGPRGKPAYATEEGLDARAYVETVLVPAILEYRRDKRHMPRDLETLTPRYVKKLSGPPRSKGRWRYSVQFEDRLARAFQIAYRPEPDEGGAVLDFERPRDAIFDVRLGRDGSHEPGRWR